MLEIIHRQPTAKTFVLDAEDNLLILRRSLFVMRGRHRPDLPGGTIKRGEDPVYTATRECKEETGLDLESLHRIGVFGRRILYVCHLPEVHPPVTTSWEHTKDIRWVHFEDARPYLTHWPQRMGWEWLLQTGEWREPSKLAA